MELICNNVTKRFGSVVALSNATLNAKAGEVRALVGGNGSGKSTLAKILGGSVAIDSGEITLDGEVYQVDSPVQAKQKGIVITSQELSLLKNLNIVQNICLCNMDRKKGVPLLDYKEMERRTRDVLKLINKEHLIGSEIGSLPANEQYLLELAKALVQKPKVLIVDEITSALYKADVALVAKILENLKREGVIVLFISHRMNEVFDMCDSVTVLRNGDTVGTFDKHELTEIALISHMSGREISSEHREESKAVDMGDHATLMETKVSLPNFGKEVGFVVRESEFVGIAGLDGQGQTTLLRSLFGMNGAIDMTLAGKQIRVTSPGNAIAHGFAFLSGDREAEGTFKERSIAENFGAVTNLVLKKKSADVDKSLQENGVKYNSSKDLIISLSGGNQQKVVIARWTCTDAKLLLADDPTKGIDIQARRDVHDTFLKMIEKGASVVMISSDDEELVETCKMMPLSRVLVMYEGEIAQTLTGGDITLEKIAAAASGGKLNSEVKKS
ncbi:sugar ABC transporter ATP-binding protein [Christensenella timonensis]|uniref:sugar ABC transporter ATP-binding protein n=1 Tax=Christensenella timonensis TaxID=1816678 RepID=UPI00082D49FB|nr:sugar ABC transporter ATP-binding protein [Christensenella timonensis]